METAEQGAKNYSQQPVQIYLRISTMLPHTNPIVRLQEGNEEIVCQSLAIDVWVSIHPAHANFALLNVISIRKLDILLKLVHRSNKDKTSHKYTRPQKQTKRTHYMGEEENVEEHVEKDSSYHLST